MKNARQRLATWGEAMAALYLQDRGYLLIERNARTAYGEIDLVMRANPATRQDPGDVLTRQGVTVFVEVKTRRSNTYGRPEEAITRRKREHLLGAAQAYLQQHPELDGDWRVDVIAILHLSPDQPPKITHFENAITGD